MMMDASLRGPAAAGRDSLPGPEMDGIAIEESDPEAEVPSGWSWSELPDDVVAKIQAQLPLASLVRSRAVCRRWNAAVAASSSSSSSGLLEERVESGAGGRDWMLFTTGRALDEDGGRYSCSMFSCAYDPGSDRWYRLPLPLWLRTLPDYDLSWMSWLRWEAVHPENRELCPTWGGGGVLAFTWHWQPDSGIGTPTLEHRRPFLPEPTVLAHICNPVAGSWASLPPFPQSLGLGSKRVLGLWVDAGGKCFKLVGVAMEKQQPRAPVRTFVFDSTLGSWSVTTATSMASFPYPEEEEFEAWRGVGEAQGPGVHVRQAMGVFVGTLLYCFNANHHLLAYDLERGSWSCFMVTSPTLLDVVYSDLISVHDRLLCAAFMWKGEGRDKSGWCLQIWEMDFARMAWTEVDAMPARMFTQFRGGCACLDNSPVLEHPPVLSALAGQGQGQDQVVYITHHNLDQIVALDLRHTPGAGAWRWLPSLPYSFTRMSRTFFCLNPWLKFGTWHTRIAPNWV